MKAEELKHQLENEEVVNQQRAEKIVIVNEQLKDAQVASKGLCFLDMTPDDFKQVLYKLQEEFQQAMIDLYTSFDEMQELYNKFSKHFETVEDHHDWIRKASAALDQVTSWKNHIEERPNGLPILDKLQLKTTEVSIQTWEGICDLVEGLFN